jgi:hypothetical protein
MDTIPYICIEDIPHEIRETLYDNLPINGGNCISVEADSLFGKWLASKGFEFRRTNGMWDWIVVFR